MRKVLITFMIMLSTTIVWGQSSSEHFTFKGVPIDGTIDEFVSKMKQKGFSVLQTEENLSVLTGDFASYNDCTILIPSLKQKNLVNRVTVIFPDASTWMSLSTNYFSIKNMLKEKYGEPTYVIEEFQGYSEPNNDRERMNEVFLDRCKYITKFDAPKGIIVLSIAHTELTTCNVLLSYLDKINSNKIDAQAMDDL
ncbi:hypothetical protein [Prevotella koreensis]